VHETLHSLTDDGARVGFLVNDAVGALVADFIGAVDGTAAGLSGVARGVNVGIFVDPLTGAAVGGLDGIFAGPLVAGAVVGDLDGALAGALVGGFDGTLVGALEAAANVLARPGVPLLSPLPYVALVTNQLAGLFWESRICVSVPLAGNADKLYVNEAPA
jgi:hypothetical protein